MQKIIAQHSQVHLCQYWFVSAVSYHNFWFHVDGGWSLTLISVCPLILWFTVECGAWRGWELSVFDYSHGMGGHMT